MAEYGEWNRKGAVLGDKTAQKEYGVSYDLIVKGIQAGQLEYREGAVTGNPHLRVLRSQLEAYIAEQLGSEYLARKKAKTEFRGDQQGDCCPPGRNWPDLKHERPNLSARSKHRSLARPFSFVQSGEERRGYAEKSRGGGAAPLTKLLRKFLEKQAFAPAVIAIDKLGSYGAAPQSLGLSVSMSNPCAP